MHYGNLRNSIMSVTADRDMTQQIMDIIGVEFWNHRQDETLATHDLTDLEYRIVSAWVLNNHKKYNTRITCIKDMREVFPGLGLAACNRMVP